MGQNPVFPVNIPIPTKNRLEWVVHLPQNGTIVFDPQPCEPQLGTVSNLHAIYGGVEFGLDRFELAQRHVARLKVKGYIRREG